MYTKDQLNELYERIVKTIDISDELFDKAEEEYINLGHWIDQETPSYNIAIYPQGSFALGTVIKPKEDRDEYDLDLVCEFEKGYGLTAKQLKCDVVHPLLSNYCKTNNEIVEKRRCWHVDYEDIPQFHMDIIPAINRQSYIDITDLDKTYGIYEYLGSNPKGYIEWFNSRKSEQRQMLLDNYLKKNQDIVVCQAEIEKIKEYKLKTPLQKVVQLLKRHRDIMFQNKDEHIKPISIIITTISAQLYCNEDNIVDALSTILNNAEEYIEAHRINGEYHIDNPSFVGNNVENFADKWNEDPSKAEAFLKWLRKAKTDLLDESIFRFDKIEIAENIKKAFGQITGDKIFNDMAEEDKKAIIDHKSGIEKKTGTISSAGTIAIPANHHHGN